MTGLVVLLYMINYADKAVYGIIAQPLAEELNLSSSQIGMVGSLFFLALLVGGYATGLLNRWFGLRWGLLILALIWSATTLPLLLSATFATLVACRMALGLAEGPGAALMHTAAYSWHAPEKRGLPSSLLIASVSFAKIIFAPLLAFVTVTWGWRAALLSLSILGVLWCLAWWPSWSNGPHLRASKNNADNVEGDEPVVSWIKIFRTRTFIFCLLLTMSFYALQTVLLTWLPSYFELGLGFSRLEAGAMFGLPSVVALVAMFGAAYISDRIIARGGSLRRARIVLPTICVITGATLLVSLPLISSPMLVVAVLSVGYGLTCPLLPLFNAVISTICPQRQLAGTMGVFLATMSIGGLIAPWLAGMIVDNAATPGQGFATSFQLLGAVAVVFAVLALVLVNPQRDQIAVRGTAHTSA
jgi:MFS family permease